MPVFTESIVEDAALAWPAVLRGTSCVPKLISGDMRVPDAKTLLETVE